MQFFIVSVGVHVILLLFYLEQAKGALISYKSAGCAKIFYTCYSDSIILFPALLQTSKTVLIMANI